MFFRRETPKTPTFAERIDALKTAGFEAAPLPGGQVRVSRGAVAAVLDPDGGGARAGVVMGGEIGWLVDAGNQKLFRTPSGHARAAAAADLEAIHKFEADLREGMGQVGLYNESLGTVSTFYLYDRVKDRDRGVPRRAWE